jgi:hypothetical protein
VIKYVYEIDYPVGQKRAYLEWVRSIADALQAPGELKRLASYDNVFSATPQRVVGFSFDSLEDAGRYFDRKELSRISKANCRPTAPTSTSRSWRYAAITARTRWLGRPLPARISPEFRADAAGAM